MQKRHILGSLALASAFVFLGSAGAVADTMAAPSGACATIANAKFQQWRQERLQMQRSKTFADGSVKNDEVIVTQDTAYKLDRGGWTSAGITLRERAVASPKHILEDMRLAECTQDGHEDKDGTSSSVYALRYLPDDNGYAAHGRIWISEMTGLPVHEDFEETAPPANGKVAKTISVTYAYNADVRIPSGAQLANSARLFANASAVRNMQGEQGGNGGPQQ